MNPPKFKSHICLDVEEACFEMSNHKLNFIYVDDNNRKCTQQNGD